MELVLSNSKLLIFMEVEGNPIFLVSKVLDVFEDLTIREITLVLWTSTVVELLEGEIGSMAFGGITIDVDSKNFDSFGFVVLEAEKFTGKGDRVIHEGGDRVEETFIVGGVHVPVSTKEPSAGGNGRSLCSIKANRKTLRL